jgi:hypothetical protein
MMVERTGFRAFSPMSRSIIIALGVAITMFLLLYGRSWPFPLLLQYARTEPIELRGVWYDGSLIGAKLLYKSDEQPVRDPFVRWEVLRYAQRFITGPNQPGGRVYASGSFVYRRCPAGIFGYIWCRNYDWEWTVPTFLAQMERLPPLEAAIVSGDTHHLEELIRAGADVKARDALGQTLIWVAPTPDILRMLDAAGARIDDRDYGGFTALMGAAKRRDVERVHVLLTAGANPNARDATGRTSLLIALSPPVFPLNVPSPALITELLRAGARVNVRDRQGTTPLMSAVRGGSPDMGGGWADIVRVLLAAHADVNARNKRGETALCMAEQEGQAQIIRLLKRAGAASE